MDAQLLQEAIAEYQKSVLSIAEALEASPGEEELVDLKYQLESALRDAKVALEGLQPADAANSSGPSADIAPIAGDASAPKTVARKSALGSNNERIHPRSKYAYEAPNFKFLAALHPSLAPYLLCPRGDSGAASDANAGAGAGAGALSSSSRASIDFTDPAACRELTRVLLLEDFGVEWWVPLGQLVPPVTNRANYIHWLEDLLSLSAPEGPVVGMDIGCGANLIYPLLGTVLCGWHFVGADVTPEALRWAARNLGANPQLAPFIELRRVAMQPEQQQFHAAGKGGSSSSDGGEAAAITTKGREKDLAAAPAAVAAAPLAAVVQLSRDEAAGSGIVSGAVRRGERFAFCMCNPPFFESIDAAGRNTATAFGGTAEEMVYPGGELAFVTAMVHDSRALRGVVHWYTTMVGKKATLRAVRSLLYHHGVRVLRTTELFQGRTSRWALAWSFTADAAAAIKPLLRFPAEGGAAPQGSASSQARQQQQQQPAARPAGCKLSWQVHAPPGAGTALLDAVQHCLQAAGVRCVVNRGAYSIRGSYSPSAGDVMAAAAEEGRAAGPDAKRRRIHAAAAGGGTLQQQWQLELGLFQQHAGLFLLTASLHKAAPDCALGWWAALARCLQDALAAQWKVQA